MRRSFNNRSGDDNSIDALSSASMGGDTKECQNNLDIGQFFKTFFPSSEGSMEDLKSVILKTNRLSCPLTLNPQESTFLDVAIWAYHNKRLSISTIEKHIRYAHFM